MMFYGSYPIIEIKALHGGSSAPRRRGRSGESTPMQKDKRVCFMQRYAFPKARQDFIETMPVPLAVFQYADDRVIPIALSAGFCRLFGYESLEQAYHYMNHDMYRDVHPDDAAGLGSAAFRFAAEGEDYDVIFRAKPSGASEYILIHGIGDHVLTDSGVRLAYIWYTKEGVYREGEERTDLTHTMSNALHRDSLVRASQFDYLTGLPTMTYSFELAGVARDRYITEGKEPVLLYIDLAGMKYFNNRFGFVEGDRLLRALSRVLTETFGHENCCHVNADRFTAVTVQEGLEETLEHFFRACGSMNDGKSLPVHIGIYAHRMGLATVSAAYDRAKIACDALKDTYSSCFRYYTRELREKGERKQYILSNLERALEQRWITVYYQPIVRAVSGAVCDEEALARWIDPEQGMISPADFIPYLEDAGLIYKLDLHILERVLEKMKYQRDAGLYNVPHSINLSRSDFDACDMVEEIRRRVDDAGIPREKITIEITESILGRDFEYMKEQITRFQSLGFPVWMDDFGSGYSSLDVLQSIKFELLKFDMSLLKKVDEGNSGRIVLTELTRMATALGMDTVCEGVETEEQMKFLQDIGCSKLQGYFYCKPIPLEEIMDRYRTGRQLGYENPEERLYFDNIGRVNMYDLTAIASEDGGEILKANSALPMGIFEVRGEYTRFVRSNQPYRDFIKRCFHFDLAYEGTDFTRYDASFMYNVVRTCCEQGIRSFYDEQMPDGTVVHSYARRIGVNPVTGSTAVAIAVLSITEPDEGTTYASIARALAADYYNIYYVDLDTERFIEYTSPVGGEELAMERHGEHFFDAVLRDANVRIYEEDRDAFLAAFSKENIIRELDRQGVFTTTYRLIDSGEPMYANMKITRMQGKNKIILGVSIIDSQMKQKALIDRIQNEQNTLAKIMALNEDYLSLYTIDADTGSYVEYVSADSYQALGLGRTGDDFFRQGIVEGKRVLFPEDLPLFLRSFSRERIMEEIRQKGEFQLTYRLVIREKPRKVTLKIAPFRENGTDKLFASVRAWRTRK